MDAIIFISIALVFTIIALNTPEDKVSSDPTLNTVVSEDTSRVAKLNDSYYEDLNAFSEIANALGFPKVRN